jgi:uncharacterized protein (TIGR03437 family)
MHISTFALIATTGIAFHASKAVAAPPVVNPGGVLNAASYAPDGMPNWGVAQGSLFVVFGTDLAAPGLHSGSYPLPTDLQGTSMRVTVKGATTRPFMVYTSPTQVGAILPSSTSTGDGTLVLTYNNVDSAPVPMHVETSRFGLFTRNSAGTGPAIAQVFDRAGNIHLNNHTDAAQPGQTAVLWGAGLGPLSGNEANIPTVADLKTDVDVLVGNQRARVIYSGRSGCCAGVDQVLFEVPQGVEGCFVPVVVRAGTAYSNFTSMSIASKGSVCSDTTGFSASDLQGLAQVKDFLPGSVELFRATITFREPGTNLAISATQDVGAAGFYRYNSEAAYAAQGVLGAVLRGASGLAPFGSCNMYPFSDNSDDLIPDPIQPLALNAGDVINIAGPRGTKTMVAGQAGTYNAQLGGDGVLGFAGEDGSSGPVFLDPGLYTVDNGSGSSQVGSFRGFINVAKPVTWVNAEQFTDIDRSKPLTIKWTGGNPASEFIVVAGISFNSVANAGRVFVCTEKADAGTFTVPSHVLASLPAAAASDGLSGLLWIGNVSFLQQNKFTASGLSAGYFYYSLFQFQNALFH